MPTSGYWQGSLPWCLQQTARTPFAPTLVGFSWIPGSARPSQVFCTTVEHLACVVSRSPVQVGDFMSSPPGMHAYLDHVTLTVTNGKFFPDSVVPCSFRSPMSCLQVPSSYMPSLCRERTAGQAQCRQPLPATPETALL